MGMLDVGMLDVGMGSEAPDARKLCP